MTVKDILASSVLILAMVLHPASFVFGGERDQETDSWADGNLIPNAEFREGELGGLPKGWELKTPYPFLRPTFKLVNRNGEQVLMATGDGNPDCIGYVTIPFRLVASKTYRMRVRFQRTDDLDPQQNLLFAFYQAGFNSGIFRFQRLPQDRIEGEGRFFVPGEGEVDGDVRLYFRQSAHGKVWISRVSLQECAPIPPRPVKVACVQGSAEMEAWAAVLDTAGQEDVDLALLPETFNKEHKPESLSGPSATLMAEKAKQHKMYVSGTFLHQDPKAKLVFNAAALYDRRGELVGTYYKNHPYSPEWFQDGISPGTEVPVFQTDFGTIGMMICYDSWFPDVAELLGLKGAEIILFPNAGYYQSLMPARASDNCTRIVVSSLNSPLGVWDTSGALVTAPDTDPSRFAKNDKTFSDAQEKNVQGLEMLIVTLDLSQSPSPHNWGGPMLSAPGGRRNRREQKHCFMMRLKKRLGAGGIEGFHIEPGDPLIHQARSNLHQI